MYKHLDLFSGIGGFSLGLEATGEFETVAFCDYEPFCQKVLRKHWEEVPIYGDIKELTYEKLRADGIDKIDIITGGYPCQPFSVAGNKKGEQDPRHLWPEYFRLVKECRPTWVIGENVGGHIKLGLDTVLKDLESEGYSTRTFSISAASIGANHKRERVWIVAHSTTHRSFNESKRNFGSLGEESKEKERGRDQSTIRTETCDSEMANSSSERLERHRREYELREDSEEGKVSRSSEDVANSERIGQQGSRKPIGSGNTETDSNGKTSGFNHGSEGEEGWWDVEPNVGRVAHGISNRVDRLKSLGNSLIPQIPYYIGQSIIKSGEIK